MSEGDEDRQGAKAFGDALQDFLDRRGMSQTELAAEVGREMGRKPLSQPWVSEIRRGIKTPTVEVSIAMERVLGAKPGQLTRHLGYLPLEVEVVPLEGAQLGASCAGGGGEADERGQGRVVVERGEQRGDLGEVGRLEAWAAGSVGTIPQRTAWANRDRATVWVLRMVWAPAPVSVRVA